MKQLPQGLEAKTPSEQTSTTQHETSPGPTPSILLQVSGGIATVTGFVPDSRQPQKHGKC